MKLHAHNPTKLFGLSSTVRNASMVILPVPWEVTVSSRSNTAMAPERILKASYELGLVGPGCAALNEVGVAMLPMPHDWLALSDMLRHDTVGYIQELENGLVSNERRPVIEQANRYSYKLKEDVRRQALSYLHRGKLMGILGGDRSVSLGFFEALAEVHDSFGILQIDAHAGLHKAYQGFTYSHASIMHHALNLPQVSQLVAVGLRDYSVEEAAVLAAEERIMPFFARDLKRKQFEHVPWQETCQAIVQKLPEQVYISFDIDGLDARFCPGTGRPVPGGLEFDEVAYLLEQVALAGKQIIGFDLCEVAPGEYLDWDAQVGSRALYELVRVMGTSQGKLTLA